MDSHDSSCNPVHLSGTFVAGNNHTVPIFSSDKIFLQYTHGGKNETVF